MKAILKYTAIAGALLLTSCDDFLDHVPDNRVFITTPQQVTDLLIDAYSQYNYAVITELSSDNLIDNNSREGGTGIHYNLTYQSPADLEAFAFEDIVSNIQQDSPSTIWSGCYHAIAACNYALEAIEKLEKEGRGDEVQAQKGEALVARAYNHFILANIFAMPYAGPELSKSIKGIPYMTEIEDKVMVNYERPSLAYVYEQIAADIEAGLPLINDELYEVPKYHFNRKAAYAFAARFYLFARDYEKVEKYATIALGGTTGNPSTLMRTYWSREFNTIPSMTQAYVSATEPANFMLIATVSGYSRHIGSRFAHNRDAKQATIYSSGPTWSGYNFHPCYSGKLLYRGSQDYGIIFPKANEIFEYTDKVAGIGYAHIVRCEFTAEETLLCRAEARLYLGRKADAIADLKIWNDARWITSTTAQPDCELDEAAIIKFYKTKDPGYGIVKPLNIDEVFPHATYKVTDDIEPILQCALHFRRIETIDDGLRFFDLKRYGITFSHSVGRGRYDDIITLERGDERLALQIPTDVLSAGFEPNRPLGSNPADQLYISREPYSMPIIKY